ncbi:MAG TPA: hypothetical protein VMU81_16130 [Acetobacteraceae bacterium]|nr:hypothetical protein [Acetobacteraceae bacterium]
MTARLAALRESTRGLRSVRLEAHGPIIASAAVRQRWPRVIDHSPGRHASLGAALRKGGTGIA